MLVTVHLSGSLDLLYRLDAFYLCGATNPVSFVQTSGWIDFGQMYENDAPGYAWITGAGYVIPPLGSFTIDGASRIVWNDTFDCGVPLQGRPGCFDIN